MDLCVNAERKEENKRERRENEREKREGIYSIEREGRGVV
jgi:hypothetical protein